MEDGEKEGTISDLCTSAVWCTVPLARYVAISFAPKAEGRHRKESWEWGRPEGDMGILLPAASPKVPKSFSNLSLPIRMFHFPYLPSDAATDLYADVSNGDGQSRTYSVQCDGALGPLPLLPFYRYRCVIHVTQLIYGKYYS